MTDTDAYLSHFFAMSIDMLCVAGTDGYFKRINPAFKKTLGYEEDELLAHPFIEFVHPDDVEDTLSEIQKLASGNPTLYFENRYRCKDGSYKWLAWTARPERDQLFSIARDITDQKRQQLAVERSEKLFRTLFNTASVGVVIVDEDGRIVMYNDKTRKLFGYPNEQLMGASLEMLLPEGKSEKHAQYRREFFDNPMVRPMGTRSTLHARRFGGTEFTAEIGLSFVETGGTKLAVAFVVDVSERERITAERERLVQDLESFAHTVAHDLKSPLGLIVGHTDLLRLDFADLSPEEVDERLDIVTRTSRKMSTIVDELLLMARVQHMSQVESSALDMGAIVDEVRARLEHMIQDYDARITAPSRWPSVRGYAPWVEEIWINYVSNALKYGGLPPRLELGAVREKDGMVRHWVRDNGRGLKPDELPRLFSDFTRLDKRKVHGHGLGLSIVKRITEKLGGRVGVESNPGLGSTFYFTLPADRSVSI